MNIIDKIIASGNEYLIDLAIGIYKVVRKAHSFRGGMDSTFIL